MFNRIKKIKETTAAGDAGKDALAIHIFLACIRLQLRWSGYMQRLASRLPKFAKMTLFLLFAAGSCCFSGYLIIDSLRPAKELKLPVIHNIRLSAHPQNLLHPPTGQMTYNFERVNKFIHFMDSLARSPSGKTKYDSIMRNNPGLLDSARNAAQLYQQH